MSNYSRALEFCMENNIALNESQTNNLYIYMEGVNIDMTKTFMKYSKAIKEEKKKCQTYIKYGDKKNAKICIGKMKSTLSDLKKEISKLDTSKASSKVYGILVAVIIDITEVLVGIDASFLYPIIKLKDKRNGYQDVANTVDHLKANSEDNLAKMKSNLDKANVDRINQLKSDVANDVTDNTAFMKASIPYNYAKQQYDKQANKVADYTKEFNNLNNKRIKTTKKISNVKKLEDITRKIAICTQVIKEVSLAMKDLKRHKGEIVPNLYRARIEDSIDKLIRSVTNLEKIVDEM